MAGAGPDRPDRRKMNALRFYEIAYILDPQLEEEQQVALIQRFSDLVTSRGGSVDHIDRWERRRLAYEIRDRREGFYVFMNITADPATKAEVDRQMGLTEGILRHRIFRRKHPVIVTAEEFPAEEAPIEEVAGEAAPLVASEATEAAATAQAETSERESSTSPDRTRSPAVAKET